MKCELTALAEDKPDYATMLVLIYDCYPVEYGVSSYAEKHTEESFMAELRWRLCEVERKEEEEEEEQRYTFFSSTTYDKSKTFKN